jgi:glycosyltransferase involved in cell wall biosynthesis
MDRRPTVSLILPAFNERQRIGQTITEARHYFHRRGLSHEILVAADGTDGTREYVREMARSVPNLYVLGGPERRGKGHGIRQAVRVASGAIVGFSDADNKTPIDELDKVLPHLDAGADVVIGSRGLETSRIEKRQKFYRRVGSRAFRLLLQMILGLPGVRDTQCGFKFFPQHVAHDLFGRQVIDGYMFDVEILYLARRSGYRIVEVPVRWRDDGDSRLQLFSGNLRNLLDVLRIRFGLGREKKTAAQPVTRPAAERRSA